MQFRNTRQAKCRAENCVAVILFLSSLEELFLQVFRFELGNGNCSYLGYNILRVLPKYISVNVYSFNTDFCRL